MIASNFTLHHGDCLDVLRTLPDASVDAVVTDPPAGIAFMGKDWDKDKGGKVNWIDWMFLVASRCLRVVKPGGHALVWSIPRTSHWTGHAWEEAGWECRDKIYHLFGSGFPKSHNLQGNWTGWGTALKPAAEEWWLLRKPFKGTVAENVLAHGTGAINIDRCRIGDSKQIPGGISSQSRNLYGAFRSGDCEENSGHNPNVGRWPANVIHDGSEEVLAGFPNVKTGIQAEHHKSNFEGVSKNCYGTYAKRSPGGYGDTGSAARFFYCAKASRSDRGDGNTHPTVKPTELMRYLCRLITPPGGTVLDPFAGSGSTGKAAMLEGFKFIGIEREQEYIEIATARIQAVLDKEPLLK